MKFRDFSRQKCINQALGQIFVKGRMIFKKRKKAKVLKKKTSFYIHKLSPHTRFLLLLLKALLCCLSAHLLDPGHFWVFSSTINLHQTMPRVRVFSRKKSTSPPKPCGSVSFPAGQLFLGILFPSSKWCDRPRTNLWLTLNSQCTFSKSEQTPSDSKRKKLFSCLEANSEKAQLCDSRQGCYVTILESGAMNGRLQARML